MLFVVFSCKSVVQLSSLFEQCLQHSQIPNRFLKEEEKGVTRKNTALLNTL